MKIQRYLPALLLLPWLLGAGEGRAQTASPPSPAEIQAGRQKMLQATLTTDPPGAARWERSSCAFDDGIASVAKARAEGHIMAPDAGEGCITAMTRQAHDNALAALYEDTVLTAMGSNVALLGAITSTDSDDLTKATALVVRIAHAIQDGSNRVDLGGGHWLTITPGLALDDGFTAAYWSGHQAQQIATDPVRLRTLTEACVGQHSTPKLCFSVGYVQGATAYTTANPGS